MITISNDVKITIQNDNEDMCGEYTLTKQDILYLLTNQKDTFKETKELTENWQNIPTNEMLMREKLQDLYNLLNYDLLDQQEKQQDNNRE